MIDIGRADKQELSEMRAWFFKENIRIQQERQALDEERRQFEREKKSTLRDLSQMQKMEEMKKAQFIKEQELFEKKIGILQNELRKLAIEKQELAREKALLKEMKARQGATNFTASPKMFFKGVNSGISLKKRYRELLKIFHPDNMNGDNDTLLDINKEYDHLKKVYNE